MRASGLLSAIAAGILLLSACGGGSSDRSSDNGEAIDTSPSTDVPAADTAPAGDVADDVATAPASLQFTAPLVGGGEIDAATLAGKPTLFWFWAPT
jgi:hypothetical protein